MGIIGMGKSFANEELTDKQKQLDVDKDGKLEKSDFEKLRASKNETQGGDHEVSMGQNSLDTIIKHATELKSKLGNDEKDIPAWIQDHISQAANFISQAATNYHEHDKPEDTPTELEEKAPEGWEGTVKAMKKHKEIDNPFALAQYMKKKGYTSHKGK